MSTNTRAPASDDGRGQGNAPQAALVPSHVMHPATGELLQLAIAPTDEVADWRLRVVELKRELDALASDLDLELARRLDFEDTRSASIGGYELVVQSPLEVVWDVERLGIALEALVADGRIARGVAERALERVVTFKPKTRELSKLLAHADPEVRAAIERVRVEAPRARRLVTVRRAHP